MIIRVKILLSKIYGGRSSVGRAPGCGPGGRGFESHRPPHSIIGPLAQLGRAVDS